MAIDGGAGLRWGEAVGLCAAALDLDAARLRAIRTVIEVAGHTSFPETTAGGRTVRLPGWLAGSLREHMVRYPRGEAGLIFANQVGVAYRRTLLRTRV